VLTLSRFVGLATLLTFPRLGCGSSGGAAAGADPSIPAPSSSVITIAAGMGFCENLETCERECDAGSSDRCRRLGVNYEFGHGVEVDGVHATQLYERSCGMGNADGCLASGRMYEFHHGVAKDDVKAVSFYTRACDLGDGAGCANLAIMLENGRGVAKDTAKAAQLFTRACERGSSLACAHAKSLRATSD
jgi:TPR repeat protein